MDPYRAAREQSTREALKLYPRLRSLVLEAHDPLETAVRLSIAGNIIDVGVSLHYDLEATIQRVLAQAFDIKDLAAFRERVPQAKRILFLADNAGETVFDRVLIETLGRPVTYVVKGGAILNDAIRVDALAAGLGEITTLVDNGSNAPGTVLDVCSPEFQRLLASSEVIIAKGQANYETLSHVRAPLFFLLQAKCSVVAQHLGVAVNSIVLKQALQT